jgi:hypothetical protein
MSDGGARTAEGELRTLWALIPNAGCLGLCVDSCGPIGMIIQLSLDIGGDGSAVGDVLEEGS